jgi:hypothetical protein
MKSERALIKDLSSTVSYSRSLDGEFVIDLGRMFIKKTRIIGTDYVEIIMEVEVFPSHRQALMENMYLSHLQTSKEVTLMTSGFNE